MKVFNVSLPLFLSLCFFAYGQGSDAVYFNGTILTMEDGQGTAQALAVKDGRITFVGSWDDAQEFITARTVRVDLHNGTLLPGFIDVHGHITSAAGMIRALDLAPSPMGGSTVFRTFRLS